MVSTDKDVLDIQRPSLKVFKKIDILDEKNVAEYIDVIRNAKRIFLQVS